MQTDLSTWANLVLAEIQREVPPEELSVYDLELVVLHDALRHAWNTLERIRKCREVAPCP